MSNRDNKVSRIHPFSYFKETIWHYESFKDGVEELGRSYGKYF